jgi:hypothetical protein
VIDDDQICFYDTCGRHFPIALENAHEAYLATMAARKMYNMEREFQQVRERVMKELDQAMEFFERGSR